MGSGVYVIVLMVLTSGSLALQWISPDLSSGTLVYACVGQDVSLPWKYQTEAAEHVIDVEWRFRGQDQTETIIATSVGNQFFPQPTIIQHVTFLSDAGIRLASVTSQDGGQYTVNVNVNLHGSVITHSQNATVSVTEPPVLSHHKLHVHLLPGVTNDNRTGQWHAQLSCGIFTNIGNPPANVVVTTPLNETVASTSFENGNFMVLLPNPVLSGRYACQLVEGPSTSCLEAGSTPLYKDYTQVNGFKVQLDVTAATLATLRSELKAERDALFNCNQRVAELTGLSASTTDRPQVEIHRPVDCTDVQRYSNVSGVHTLYIGNTSFPVYCDQDTDGGGWTVFQRRQDGSVNFTRLYHEFETGFGDPHGEFWLGLKNIHQLTSQAEYDLRVDMEDFEHNSTYALYNNFSIADGTDKYRLHLGSLVTGPSANSGHMSYNDGFQFSALGNDNSGYNCVATRRGTGWWFGNCTWVNPNGLYLHGYEALASGDTESKIIWNSFRGHHYSLKRIEMKVRRHIR
ncbi:fibrinogen C domain-containing protein 1-A-like isoform X2 [Littorina saxatilis]|uniref:Fibrinogen C-terminal domain-containing protein n=1 Tax=Littorina saxatilis TaxID=31220 RepID=A0AAN9G261_9CAEN